MLNNIIGMESTTSGLQGIFIGQLIIFLQTKKNVFQGKKEMEVESIYKNKINCNKT